MWESTPRRGSSPQFVSDVQKLKAHVLLPNSGSLVRLRLHETPQSPSPRQRSLITLAIHNDHRYHQLMIASFRDADAEKLWKTGRSRRVPANLRRPAARKLAILNAATTLDSLKKPPGNRLEALTRDRLGQHSIRINDQYRVCFVWKEGNAYDVEIVDYH
jgi:toxin HigB-1